MKKKKPLKSGWKTNAPKEPDNIPLPWHSGDDAVDDALRDMDLEEEEFFSPNIGCK